MNEEEIARLSRKLNATIIGRVKIGEYTNSKFYPPEEKPHTLKRELMEYIMEQIDIKPLYGGGFNQDKEFEFIIIIKNTKRVLTYWEQGWNPALRVIAMPTFIEQWLWQKRAYFGWKTHGRI